MDSTEVSPDDARASDAHLRDPTPPSGGEKKDDGTSKKATVRKRTKTGCLTCRKRRIKCDEGKPTCNNCIKSKRQCEGYNQRVVFKEPINAFHGGSFNPMVFQTQPAGRMLNPQLSNAQSKASAAQGPLPAIAPKPSSAHFPPAHLMPQGFEYMGQQTQGPSDLPLDLNSVPYDRSAFLPNTAFMEPPQPGHYPPEQSLGADDGLMYNQSHPELQDQHPMGQFLPVHHESRFPGGEPPIPVQHGTYIDQGGLQSNMYLEDDQYWDVSDDEELMADSGDEGGQTSGHLLSNDQGVQVLARLRERQGSFDTHIRTFSAMGTGFALTNYRPSLSNSPLTDTQTAAIFWHFVTVTGPSMSLYERHPVDPSPMFSGEPVPTTKQHIWTYTFPILALNHSALLQAMLALGSLQMAKLDGHPPVASLKHYAICLRRLQKNYESPVRRLQPATLAATLLLGFYEVWNSDHDKWCKHMWGARAILKEIPLSEMTSAIMRLKQEKRNTLDTDWDQVNIDLLTQLCGRRVRFAEPGHVSSTSSWVPPTHYTEQDIETYEHVRDLYWWYCKMDVYQSILGGTPLLMDYDLWTQCGPRATIGKIDCIFGTFDHLMLLMGRLCNFASRDMERKRKSKKAGPPGPGGSDNSPPGFPGLMPASGKVTIPKGFSPPRDKTPPSDTAEDMDIEARTAAALQEWEAIRQALELFKAQLGPDFEPMGADLHPASQSPFGPVLNYRTYGIAGIWLNYLMAMIVLHRSHPSMPPVAMMAAGMAARQSAPFAAQIGQIVAGLVEDCAYVDVVSTLSGAIFIESSFPLFVSAVQYQNHDQRIWTIKRLHDVSRLTGWQSARQMAGGCESAWMKAASMGRGPPYKRPTESELEVPRTAWPAPKRILDRIQELGDSDQPVTLTKSERPSYAFGLLSMEEEMEKLELDDDKKEEGNEK